MADEVTGDLSGTLTVTPEKAAPRRATRQDGALDQLTRLGQSGPPWAAGLAVVLAALVSFVLALGLNVSGMLTTYIDSNAEGNKQQLQLQSNEATMAHDSEVRIIDALDGALREQSQRIAGLTVENQDLKTTVLTLQFQVKQLATQYGIADVAVIEAPTYAPVLVATATPAPTQEPLSVVPEVP